MKHLATTKTIARWYKMYVNGAFSWEGYLPSGLHESAVICSSASLQRKSTKVHRTPVPLGRVPTKEGAPDLIDAALPGKEAAQMHIPPLKNKLIELSIVFVTLIR